MRTTSLFSLVLVVFLTAFFLHFVWEMWQIPLYSGMSDANHWAAVVQCTLATFGDGVIALVAYGVSAIIAQNKLWLFRRSVPIMFVYLVSGLTITVLLEFLATEVYGRWQYSELMPILPVINVGLSPLVQWIIIPPIGIWISVVILNGLSLKGAE